jgi:hypothetical protein
MVRLPDNRSDDADHNLTALSQEVKELLRLVPVDEQGRPSDWIVTRQLPKEEQTLAVEAAMRGGLWGWVAEHCDIALLEDCRKDPRWMRFPDDPNPAGSA